MESSHAGRRFCLPDRVAGIALLIIKSATDILLACRYMPFGNKKVFPFELKIVNSHLPGHANMKKTRRQHMDMEIDMAFAIAFVALIAGLFLGPISKIDEFLHRERNPWENGDDA